MGRDTTGSGVEPWRSPLAGLRQPAFSGPAEAEADSNVLPQVRYLPAKLEAEKVLLIG